MKKLAIIVLFLILAGCTTTKINPVFEIPKGSKIGVINLVGHEMKNYSVELRGSYSMDQFSNVSNMPYYINDEIKKQATEIGYKVEILEVNEDIIKSFYNGNIEENHQIVLSPETIPVFQKLANDHNLSIIYIIREVKGKFKARDFNVFLKGYGLAMDLDNGIFSAFAFFKADAIYLDPVTLTRGADCMEKKDFKNKELDYWKGYKGVSFNDIAETIKLNIKKFISDLLINSNLKH
jgi:hypothetical protein